MSTMIPSAAARTRAASRVREGDFVVYRDPARFWSGRPDHTLVCAVGYSPHSHRGVYNLHVLATGFPVRGARAEYMRLLPPAACMRDIDAMLPLAGAKAVAS